MRAGGTSATRGRLKNRSKKEEGRKGIESTGNPEIRRWNASLCGMPKSGWAIVIVVAFLLASEALVVPSALGQGIRSGSSSPSLHVSAAGPDPGCPPSVGITGVSASGLNVSVSGYVNSCGSTTISYVAWSWGDGINDSTWFPGWYFPAIHSYCNPGTYTITATAVQSDGEKSDASATAVLSGPSCSPAILLQNAVTDGLNVSINGTASACSAGTSVASLSWEWGDGTGMTTSGFPGSHTYSSTGSYLVSAMARQSDGKEMTAAEWVSVSPNPQTLWQAIGPKSIESRIPSLLCPNAYEAQAPSNGGSLNVAELGFQAAGKINAFAIDPANASIMYAGGGAGPGDQGPYSDSGLSKSVDGGRTWFPLREGFTGGYVDRIWVDPTNPNIVVAGTFDQGIFYSDDAGGSWRGVFANYGPPAVHAIVQDGSDLLAAVSPLIVVSSNSGLSWSVITSLPSQWFTTLAEGGGTVWAGLTNGTVIKGSLVSGVWSGSVSLSDPSCGGNGVSTIAINPTNPANVYVDEACGTGGHLYVTTDGGQTWTNNWTASDAVSSHVNSAVDVIAVDPTNASVLYAGAGGALWKSVDGGHTFAWTPMGGVDCRGIFVYSGGRVVLTGDQGIYMSSDGGKTWKSLSGGLTNPLLSSFAVANGRIFTAVQDWSPIVSLDNGISWSVSWDASAPLGEDGAVEVNPGNSSNVYEFTTYGFQLSTDGGVTFHLVQSAGTLPGVLPIGEESNLIGVDRTHPGTVYIATQEGVFKSVDWGSTFSNTTWPFVPARLVAVYPGDSQTIFVGNYTGLYYSNDGGASWRRCVLPSNLGPLVPGVFPDSIAFDPENASVVLLSLLGTTTILRSVNGGVSFSDTAGVISGYLPNYFSRQIELAFEPNTSYVAAATTGGIFVSPDLGATWFDITRNAISTAFSGVQWSGSYLYASTYGEGVLRLPIPPPPQNLESIEVSSTSVSIEWQPPPTEVWNYTVNYGARCGSWLGSMTVSGTSTSLTVSGLAPSTSYCVAVSTWGPAGEGPLSAFLIVNTLSAATTTSSTSSTTSTLSSSSASSSVSTSATTISTSTAPSTIVSISSSSTQTTGPSSTSGSTEAQTSQLPLGEIAIGIGIAVAGVAIAIALVLRKPRAHA